MADNDVAKLIMEIEALRAELRAALGNKQGQLVQTGNTSPAANSAVQALGLHSLTANGFVSGLTGSRTSSMGFSGPGWNDFNSKMEAMKSSGMSTQAALNKIFSNMERRYDVTATGGGGGAAPNLTANITSEWLYRGGKVSPFGNEGIFGKFGNTRKIPRLGDIFNRENIQSDFDNTKIRPQSISGGLTSSLAGQWGSGFDRLQKRAWSKFSRTGALMGFGVSAASSIKSLERGFNSEGREQFLTQAEIRSGMTHEERFGKDYSLSDHVMGAIGSAAVNAGQWAAMGMALNAMQDPKTFAKSRMYMAGAQGAMSLQNQSSRMPGTAFYRFGKGVGAAAMGLARGFAPAAALLTAVKLGEMIFSSDSDWNTWIKKSEQSNKKLKDQMDELHSIDKFTSEQQIESQLVKRGMSRSTASTAWRGGLSALGIVENPAEREGRLRAEISEDLSQASKAGAEALVEARLGNISKSEKMISEARLQAGDLVPAYWQDPLRVYTLQETASRSKACFARYLNNRTTNRSGD